MAVIHQLLEFLGKSVRVRTYAFNPGLLSRAYGDANIGFGPNSGGLSRATRRAAELPLAFQPGLRWEYSIGTDILGLLVETVSGKSLDQFFHEQITAPLGMRDTGFSVPQAKQNRFASCYSKTENNTLLLVDSAKNSEFRQSAVDTFSGGGGLISTLWDYFQFVEMIRAGGILGAERLASPRTINFMLRNHLTGDIASMGPKSFAEMPMDGMGFGLGGAVVIDPARTRIPGSIGDFGWGGMASTYFWIDPVEQLSVIFLTQLIPSNTYPCRAELKALVHAALTG